MARLACHRQSSLLWFWKEPSSTETQVLVAGNELDHTGNGSVQGYGEGLSVNDADVQRMSVLSS